MITSHHKINLEVPDTKSFPNDLSTFVYTDASFNRTPIILDITVLLSASGVTIICLGLCVPGDIATGRASTFRDVTFEFTTYGTLVYTDLSAILSCVKNLVYAIVYGA